MKKLHPEQKSNVITYFMVFLGATLALLLLLNFFYFNYIESRYIAFASMLTLAISFWIKKEANSFSFDLKNNKYTPCWRTGLFLFFLVIGLNSLIYNSYGAIEIFASRYLFAPVDVVQTVQAGNLPSKDDNSEKLLTFMTFIIGIASAYYLITLQGTWKQAQDLLKKLKDREEELKVIRSELENIKNNESTILMSIGGYLLFIGKSMHIKTDEKQKIKISAHTEMVDHVLNLNENLSLVKFNRTSAQEKLSTIHADANSIYKNLTISKSEIDRAQDDYTKIKLATYRLCHSYVPMSLLQQTKQYINNLPFNTLSKEEQSLARETLTTIAKLKREIEQHEESA